MFPPSPSATHRPTPVPSKAALRALYQLAYISSGTALGIAALCAEERRRRTAIVAKIADNAQRLRESPRHVDNSSPAEGLPGRGGGDGTAQMNRTRRRSFSTSHPAAAGAGTQVLARSAKDENLPSHVERAYEQLEDGKRRPSRSLPIRQGRQRRSAERSNFWIGREARQAGDSRESAGSAAEDAKRPSWFVDDVESGKGTRKSGNRNKRVKEPTQKPVNGYERASDTIFWGFRPHSANIFLRNMLRSQTRAFERRPMVFKHGTDPSLRTGPQAVGQHADLETELEEFFRTLPTVDRHTEKYVETADALLKGVLHHGTLAQARSLILWRFATGKVQVFHPDELCRTLVSYIHGQIGQADEEEGVLDFLDEIFETGRISRMPPNLQLELGLAMVEAKRIIHAEGERSALVEKYLHVTWEDAPVASSLKSVDLVVKKFAKAKRYAEAMSLLDAWEAYSSSKPTHLLRLLFDSSMNQRRFVYCSTILLQRRTPEDITRELLADYEKLIITCGRKGLVRLLRVHFEKLQDDQAFLALLMPQLSVNARAILVSANADIDDLTTDSSVALDNIFKTGLSHDIIGKRVARRIKRDWRTTRDLQAVKDLFKEAHGRASEQDFSSESMQSLEIALIEVMSEAGQVEQALQLLAVVSGRGQETTHLLCAVLPVLAKKRAWKQFDELIKVLSDRTDLAQDAYNLRNFEKALHLYTLDHSADDIWQFATLITAQLKIPITQRLTDIVLESFVENRQIQFIPEWLSHASSLNGEADLNERSVANLLTHFFLKHRLPHTYFMAQCYNFIHRTGYRDHQTFMDVVTDSIAYDMRHNSGNPKNMPTLLRLVAENYRRVRSAGGVFPEPSSSIGIIMHDQTLKRMKVDEQRQAARKASQLVRVSIFGNDVVPEEEHMTANQLDAAMDEADAALDEDDDLGDEHAVSGLEVFDDSRQNTSVRFDDLHEEQSDDGHGVELRHIRDRRPWSLSDDLPVRPRKLESEMLLGLSRRDRNHVLELYRSSLGPGGMPASSRALEIAVEACFLEPMATGEAEHDANTPEETDADREAAAKKLVSEARFAGMNTASAQGPLLLREMSNFSSEDRRYADKFRRKIVDYYRTNEDNGLKLKKHVGVHAANLLINNHCALDGLRLLRDLFPGPSPAITGTHLASDEPSDLSKKAPLIPKTTLLPKTPSPTSPESTIDLASLTVYLKGLIALNHTRGIHWTVDYILDNNLRVDIACLNTLRNQARMLLRSSHIYGLALAKQVHRARLALSERRIQQKMESGRHMKDLLYVLSDCRKKQLQSETPLTTTTIGKKKKSSGRRQSLEENGAPSTEVRTTASAAASNESTREPWTGKDKMSRGYENDRQEWQLDVPLRPAVMAATG